MPSFGRSIDRDSYIFTLAVTFFLFANAIATILVLLAFQIVGFAATGTRSLHTHITVGAGIAGTTDGPSRLTIGTSAGTLIVNRTINRLGGGTTGITLHPGRDGIGTNIATAQCGILTNDRFQIHARLRNIR